MNTINDPSIKTHIKLNPRTSVQINRVVNSKIKEHKKSMKEIGHDVTDLQVINAGLEALKVIKPTDVNILNARLSQKEVENQKMINTIAALHMQIQKLKKHNANSTNK